MSDSKFQTIVEIPKYNWETGYQKKNIFLGSCFTENVGNKMASLKYDADINPFGILYNPVSVANALSFLLNEKVFSKSDLVQYDGLWHSFFHHGRFSYQNEKKVLDEINKRIKSSSDYFKNADFLFITFGTAWIYEFIETGQVVSNCHKIPAKKFNRRRLSIEEIVTTFSNLLVEIKTLNPKLKIIFTVSPIRHWKDGAMENQKSKATLLLAIDKIINEFGPDFCNYFPSYEIVMDELRDYRFYADDMIHISDLAINHIWNIFEKNLINSQSSLASELAQKILMAANHKPFNKNTKEHLNFLNKSLKKSINLEAEFPFLNFKLEKEYFITEINEIEKIVE